MRLLTIMIVLRRLREPDFEFANDYESFTAPAEAYFVFIADYNSFLAIVGALFPVYQWL